MTHFEWEVIRNRQRRNAKKQSIALRRKAKAARRWNRKAKGKQKRAQRRQERKYPATMGMHFECKERQCPLVINDCTNCVVDRVVTYFGKEYRSYDNDNTTKVIW